MAPLHRGVAASLLADIATERLAEGERLPTLPVLADRFQVSPGVVREAQRALAERGMLSVHHGRRAVVTTQAHWDVLDPDVLSALLRSGRGTELLAEYLEARRTLEVEAAGLAAERWTRETLAQLDAAYADMEEAAQQVAANLVSELAYRDADIMFHKAIVIAAANRPLGRMSEPIHAALYATFGELARPDTRLDHGLPEHRRVLEAIRIRDTPGAREAMAQHMLTVARHLRESEVAGQGRTAAYGTKPRRSSAHVIAAATTVASR